MSKFRVTFDVDLSKICPEDITETGDTVETAEKLLSSMLLEFARKSAIKNVQKARMSNLTTEDKARLMAEHLRRVKLTLQAEANLSVNRLPDNTVVLEDTPARKALAA